MRHGAVVKREDEERAQGEEGGDEQEEEGGNQHLLAVLFQEAGGEFERGLGGDGAVRHARQRPHGRSEKNHLGTVALHTRRRARAHARARTHAHEMLLGNVMRLTLWGCVPL